MKKSLLPLLLTGTVLLPLSGCFGQAASGLAQNLSGLFSPDPVYWTDAQGYKQQVVFTQGEGSDLKDAYQTCDKNWECYNAYITYNQATYKKRRRGQIRLHTQGAGIRVYAEHHMNMWTEEILAPFCFLTLKLDAQGGITAATYKK
jgi:hypothetical protein